MKDYRLSDIKLICEQTRDTDRCGINCPVAEFCKSLLRTNIPKNWNIESISEPAIYTWFVQEDDDYNYGESAYAKNLEDAFYKATEYSPKNIKTITINKTNELDVQVRSDRLEM